MNRVQHLELIIRYARQYFTSQYHGGTREMIRRYVAQFTDATPMEISAALQILKNERAITYDKGVWWGVNVG